MNTLTAGTKTIRTRLGKVRSQGPSLDELNGKACLACGCVRYYFVLRAAARGADVSVAARCSDCHQDRLGAPEVSNHRGSTGFNGKHLA